MKKLILTIIFILGSILLANNALAIGLGDTCSVDDDCSGNGILRGADASLKCAVSSGIDAVEGQKYCLVDSGGCCKNLDCNAPRVCLDSISKTPAACIFNASNGDWDRKGGCVNPVGGDDCSGECKEKACSTYNDCNNVTDSTFCTTGNCCKGTCTNKGGGGGGGGGGTSGTMSDCIKLRADVKIGSGAAAITFAKDSVISPYKIDNDDQCKYGSVTTPGTGGCTASQRCFTPDFGIIIVLGYLNFITGWLFYILMLISTIFIVYGGFKVVTSAGDPEKAGAGRKVVTFAVIGFAVALLARVVPSLVRFVIGV